MPEEPRDAVPVPLAFLNVDEHTIELCNHVLVQFNGPGTDEFIVLMGQVAPPVLLGTPEEQRHQLTRVSYVPVNVVARLSMTRARLQQSVEAMQQALMNYDAATTKQSQR